MGTNVIPFPRPQALWAVEHLPTESTYLSGTLRGALQYVAHALGKPLELAFASEAIRAGYRLRRVVP